MMMMFTTISARDSKAQGVIRVCITNGKKQKARPKGINLKVRWMIMMLFLLESEIRIAISLLGQRPPRYTGVGRS